MAMPCRKADGTTGLEWPSFRSLEWGSDALEIEGRLDVTLRCSFGCLRAEVEEVLWHATDTAGEFVEIANVGAAPLILPGCNSPRHPRLPAPAEWKTGVAPRRAW